jgi:hypothetical protein
MKLTTLEHKKVSTIHRDADGTITISIPIRIRKYSGRQQVILPQNIVFNDFKEKQDLTVLQTALARGRQWQKMLESGKFKTLREIAEHEDVDPGYVSRLMNMNLLCPEIVRRILDDDIESDFAFSEIYRDIPARWDDQFRKFKMSPQISN